DEAKRNENGFRTNDWKRSTAAIVYLTHASSPERGQVRGADPDRIRPPRRAGADRRLDRAQGRRPVGGRANGKPAAALEPGAAPGRLDLRGLRARRCARSRERRARVGRQRHPAGRRRDDGRAVHPRRGAAQARALVLRALAALSGEPATGRARPADTGSCARIDTKSALSRRTIGATVSARVAAPTHGGGVSRARAPVYL